ncbi:protein BREAST CANCER SUSCEPTIBILITY 1 homolog isoform X2 [Corylus avellana]|uniref:protein BREAST CANCER SUSCEPTIBILITY 1 homolog isoform X2 n=1 Tax=Corylus avellana TaxID=13451 RepID=UPI00286C8C6C|nr:protein BREAST CANCER SUSCEPTIBILITY 1 homolog isoform X2 [Corylus avellana]
MGDASHLEKMGRELKCPICLSLLNSAVSLTCNHVFCNLCIVKSMKLGSTCPVCKVPFRRREVRPAPHMDNLVSVYKSMEVASGINIFVTQNAPSTKFSDKEEQAEGEGNHGEQDSGGNCQDRSGKQNTLKGKGSRKKSKSNMKNTSSTFVKPSFPTKKRVQVPQCPFSESPARRAILEGELSEIDREEPKKSSTIVKDKPVLYDKGEPVLSPFFWLRDEEGVEKSSQHTDEGEFMDMTPLHAPAFSDIKDSDDEYPSNSTPTGLHGKCSSVADFFDSEMFEWTQRPCSPELCSSPFKMQVANVEEINEIQEKELEAALQDVTTNEEPSTRNEKCMNSKQGSGPADGVLPNVSSPRTEGSSDQIGSNKSNKSGKIRKASERAKKKCPKRHTDSDFEIYIDLNKASENFIQEQTLDNNYSLDKISKRSKKSHIGTSTTKPTPKSIHAVSVGTETLDHGDESAVIETPLLLGKKEGNNEVLTLKKAGKRHKKIDCSVRSEKRKLDSLKNNVLKVVKTRNQKDDDTNKKVSGFGQKPSKPGKETKSRGQELRSRKKLKVSSYGILKDELVNDIQEGHTYVPTRETQHNEKVQGRSYVKSHDDTSVVQKLPSLMNKIVLQKCGTISNKFQCAFCLSSEESEASGEMVHYYNGRPVAADHDGESKLIHSHRNCTEWAPNVYFQDDNAINLEAELTRSRRIKCCCCGNKGAALGCYAKNCRKSFHVPCAKLTPQCRWDTDNFVMLCPLHASSKLPSESPQEMRKKYALKGKLSQCDDVASKNVISTDRNWKFCVSSKKLVLCCSALTTAEGETVSDFERLSGVTVLKKWDSSVTHVIASTNENGACRRTLKILMGILEGKWILNMEWIKACMKVMELVDEEPYEIAVDIHGIRDGPRLGRLRLLNKQPKLFDGCKFYFMGEFLPAYKGYLQDLVIAAGGTILHRRPVSEDQNQTFIIYSLELPDKCNPSKKTTIFNCRRSDAEAMASSTGAKVASNSWVLNSIAACHLQNLAE